MSKIIKAADWKERPVVIETPKPPEPEQETEPEDGAAEKRPAVDEAALKRRLDAAAEKEKQAEAVLEKAKADAEAIKQEAEAEKKQAASDRERLLDEAHQEAEELRQDAIRKGHDEGYQAGEEEGKAEAKKQMADAIQQANEKAEKTLRDANAATQSYLAQAENDVTDIAMAVVNKILPQHFIDVPQVILPLVEQALGKVRDQKEINIHVAPASYDLVLMARDELRSKLTGAGADLQIVSDESLAPGDCVIETPNGSVDARLKTQLELIKEAIESMKE